MTLNIICMYQIEMSQHHHLHTCAHVHSW